MELWGGIIIGLIMGIIFTSIILREIYFSKHWVGTLRIDRSDPEEPYYFLEVAKGATGKLKTSKSVILDVEHSSYIDQIVK